MSEQRQTVQIDLRLIGTTDRDPHEWGECLARWMSAEMNDTGNAAFGPISVECMDVETITQVKR